MPVQPLHNEKELLLRVTAGDQHAFTTLYYHYQDAVFSIALRITRSPSIAEEVLQEIFIKLWLNHGQLAQVQHFQAYLYTITRNHIYNALRKMAYQQAVIRELEANASQIAQYPDTTRITELHDLLQKEVEKLPLQQQHVFRLGKLEGLTHEEIAIRLRISRETVKKHMMEAIRRIREGLGSTEGYSTLFLLTWIVTH